MAEPTDVTPASSAEPEGTVPPQQTDSPSVTTGVTEGGTDRPLENIRAEFDRKLTKVERQMQEIASYLGAMAQVAPSPQKTDGNQREYSDAELLAMARAGSDQAMDLYVQRKVTAVTTTRETENRADLLVKGQLAALYRSYPILTNDASHPLTQAALQAKRLLMLNGYQESLATDLEAVKTAIAEYPDLAAQARVGSSQVAETVRRSTVNSQQDVEGRTTRREPRASVEEKVSDRSLGIASRMGVKDPKKSKERFFKNQAAGRSSVSPTLSILLREEGG